MIHRISPINLPKSPEVIDVLNAKVCLGSIVITAAIVAVSLFPGVSLYDFYFSKYLIIERKQVWRVFTSGFWCLCSSTFMFWLLRFLLLFVIESFVIWEESKLKMIVYCAFAFVWVSLSMFIFPAPWMVPRLSVFHLMFLIKSLPLWLIRDSPFITSLGFFLSLIVAYTNDLFNIYLFIVVGVQLFYYFYFVFPNILFID